MNKPRNSDEVVAALNSPKMEFRNTEVTAAVKTTLDSACDSSITNNSPVDPSSITNNSPVGSHAEIEEISERPDFGGHS